MINVPVPTPKLLFNLSAAYRDPPANLCRTGLGSIVIANSDVAAAPYMDTALDQPHLAVEVLAAG